MRFLCRITSLRKSSANFFHSSSVFYKIVQFNLSDIGEGIREVTVKDWFVKVGDKVSQFENICLVESDKASVSITSRFDGIVKKLYYEVGDTASVGKPLVDIDVENESSVVTDPPQAAAETIDRAKPEPSGAKSNATAPQTEHLPVASNSGPLSHVKAFATPSVRRIAMENSISLGDIEPTGKGGRVLKEDILRHLERITAPAISSKENVVITSDQSIPIKGIKKAMVKTMTKSNSIPTFGYCDEIDMTKLIQLRTNLKEYAAQKGVNISFMPFFIKALSKAIEEFPIMNATVDENCENLTIKHQHNIGVAMDTKEGLIVPNIKDVQSLSVLEVGIQLNRLIEDGRSMKLTPADMAGGTITISNIGIIGGTYLRPLILPPEVCILALGKSRLTPTFNEKEELVKKYVLNASWAADHRVIDGATIAKFSNTWKDYIENPNYLLMNL